MDAIKDLKWVVLIIILVWFVWFFTGGPQRDKAIKGPFIKPPRLLDTGRVYDGIDNTEISAKKDSGIKSLFADEVKIFITNGVKESNPNKEYLELRASFNNSNPVLISGWKLRNSKGDSSVIGGASKLPIVGKTNREAPLILRPGDSVFIVTGRSPLGVSFQTNTCSGYLEQFQDFYPRLQKNCPVPISDLYKAVGGVENSCSSYVSTLPNCKIIFSPPNSLSSSCKAYITNDTNYNSCVSTHKNDMNFYKKKWRLFLGKNNEMWRNSGDLVRLYDQQGRLVDSRSY